MISCLRSGAKCRFPSMPIVSRRCSEPSSYGRVLTRLLKRRRVRRYVHMPSSAGSSEISLYEASRWVRWRRRPTAGERRVSLLEAM